MASAHDYGLLLEAFVEHFDRPTHFRRAAIILKHIYYTYCVCHITPSIAFVFNVSRASFFCMFQHERTPLSIVRVPHVLHLHTAVVILCLVTFVVEQGLSHLAYSV